MSTLLNHNAVGLSVITTPAGVRRDSSTFMTVYDYLQKYKPDVIAELFYQNGRESMTGMISQLGYEGTYSSDQVKHAEMGRLHNRISALLTAETYLQAQ
jgi:hypothetical protein